MTSDALRQAGATSRSASQRRVLPTVLPRTDQALPTLGVMPGVGMTACAGLANGVDGRRVRGGRHFCTGWDGSRLSERSADVALLLSGLHLECANRCTDV